jgi:hypothetical protein
MTSALRVGPRRRSQAVFVWVLGVGAFGALCVEFGVLRFERIRDVFQEDQPKHDMLVLGRVHVVAQRIGRLPELRLETELGGAVLLPAGAGRDALAPSLCHACSNVLLRRRAIIFPAPLYMQLGWLSLASFQRAPDLFCYRDDGCWAIRVPLLEWVALGIDGVEHSTRAIRGAEGRRLTYLRIENQRGAAAIA